jgi:hypothetical protein
MPGDLYGEFVKQSARKFFVGNAGLLDLTMQKNYRRLMMLGPVLAVCVRAAHKASGRGALS